VLTDPGQRRLFWETTSGPEWRGESESVPLTRAPVVIVPLAHKQAYLDRYALPDKAHTPLSREAHWPAPYWDIDTGFGVMMILLTAVDLGLGALFFAIFAGEQALMDAFGVPEGYRPIGAIAVGHPTPGERSKPELRTGRRPPRRRREVGALVTALPNTYADWNDSLHHTAAPGLVLVPSDDPFGDATASRQAAETLGARIRVLEGAGHWWALQKPAEAASILTAFISSVD
jgi:pimeloyl-ACP methyl ester carboxylesterase